METAATTNFESLRTKLIASFMLAVNDVVVRPHAIRTISATYSW